MDTIYPYSFEVEASELPERLRAQLPKRQRFVVEIFRSVIEYRAKQVVELTTVSEWLPKGLYRR